MSGGLNRVVVYYPNPKALITAKLKGKGAKLKPGEQPPPSEPSFLTPLKYAVATTSELSVTVEKPTVFDAALTGPEIR